MTPIVAACRRIGVILLIGAMALMLGACSDTGVAEPELGLPPIPTMDIRHLGADVGEQLAAVQQRLTETPLDGHLNARYAKLLHAYSLNAPAVVMYRRCQGLRPGDLECMYLEALLQRELGNTPEAIRLLEALLERKPDFPRASVVLASSYRERGQAALALPLFEAAVAADGDNLEAVYGLAMSTLDQGLYAEAARLLHRLHDDGRQFGIVHAALATLARQDANLELAAFHVAAAQRFADSKIPYVDPVLWAVQEEQIGEQRHIRDARAHFKAGRLPQAARAYLLSLESNPDNAASHASLVSVFGQMGDIERARHHFAQARALDPTGVAPLESLGTAHMKRGEFAEARALFSEALALQPSNAEVRTLEAYCRQLLGESVEPDAYRRALEDDPTQSLAHYLLGRQLAKEQDCSAALPHFEASVRIESARTPAFMADLARCLARAGRRDEAYDALSTGKTLATRYNNAGAARALELTERELAGLLDEEGS